MGKLAQFRPLPVPPEFKWALEHAQKNGPEVMRQAFKTYGLKETVGAKHTPEILEMADALGGVIDSFYTADEIPWCGLGVSYWLKMAGATPPKDYSQVRARDFASWGNKADRPSFGDVLVFWRGSRTGRDGHVGHYVCETKDAYYVLGANQGNAVKISPLAKDRLLAARRIPWKVAQPSGVKPFMINSSGKVTLSENEA